MLTMNFSVNYNISKDIQKGFLEVNKEILGLGILLMHYSINYNISKDI